jgi:hypothetical protein
MPLTNKENRKQKIQRIILSIGIVLGCIGLLCGHYMSNEQISNLGLYVLAGTGLFVVLMGWIRGGK